MSPRRLLDAPEFNTALFAFLLHLPWEFWQVPFFDGMAAPPYWSAVRIYAPCKWTDRVGGRLEAIVSTCPGRGRGR